MITLSTNLEKLTFQITDIGQIKYEIQEHEIFWVVIMFSSKKTHLQIFNFREAEKEQMN